MMKKLNSKEIEKMSSTWLSILDCFEKCQSLEHLCVLLDLHKLTRPKKIDLGFLTWISDMANSSPLWLGRDFWKLSWDDRRAFFKTHPTAKKMVEGGRVMNRLWVAKLRRIVLSYAKSHIDEIVSEDRALRWLKTRAFAKRGKNSSMSELKDTLLYYWLKKHHRDIYVRPSMIS